VKQFVSITARRFTVFIFDLFAIGIAFVGAFALRFDFKVPPAEAALIIHSLPWVFLIQAPVFVVHGLYRGLWAFASLRDLLLIVRAVFFATVLSLCFFFAWDRLIGWPRSIFLIDAGLLVLTVGGARFTYRAARETFWRIHQKRTRILIVGAGRSASLIARETSSQPELSTQVVGFLDDDPRLVGIQIHGAAVLGQVNSLDRWLSKLKPDQVVIAIPSLAGPRVKEILSVVRKHNIQCRICPPIRDMLLGKVKVNQLREVHVEDVLPRDVVKVDDTSLGTWITGRCIMVTGAGGSIGSELCRQVLKYKPSTLVLYERSEFNLYQFERELRRDPTLDDTRFAFVIGDILNEKRLQNTFSKYKPEIILHAAAYKHVPLMEENIFEALNNNVLGTYRLVMNAAASGIKHFVMISSDKAVRPTSVMGATKRMAELVVHSIGKRSAMTTTAVRFGNVLDSQGSVLPLFRAQIANGGPVTVTHPEVTRFFMTIPEASQLVLQASLLGRGGEIFLLDMGEPILIRELAEELIRLSGLRPYEDIDIVFTGLRHGEKLYEELLIDMSHAKRTAHPKIMVSTQEMDSNLPDDWETVLRSFAANEEVPRDENLLAWIQGWVPCYVRTVHGKNVENPADQDSKSSDDLTETTVNAETQYLH